MKPLDLLIVEDNPADQEIIKRHLEANELWDFNIRCSDNLTEADLALDDYLPELIVLDHQLPGKNGLKLLEKFQEEGCYIPVIMLTGNGSENFVSQAIRRGADDYIAKDDLSFETLKDSIEHVMNEFHENLKQNLKMLKLELKCRTGIDELTDLYDRNALMKKIKREINLLDRTSKPLTLLFIDLDNFKIVNDKKGHVIGDKLLRRVGEELGSIAREEDFVARYGGDEFCVLLPRTDIDTGRLVGKRIVCSLDSLCQEWLSTQQITGRLSVSIGLAEMSDYTTTAEEFIDQADRAMYSAKEAGGGDIATL